MSLSPSLGGSLSSIVPLHNGFHDRVLQFEIPDYTSPPLEEALAATPEDFRDDAVIDKMRDLDAAGNCTSSTCFIPFQPATNSTTGILLYGGGLVDPRAYAVLAQPLAEEGYTVLIPVFANDLAFGVPCGTGRLEFAQELYPDIDTWVLAGHSFGGVAAMSDAWLALEDGDTTVGGVVLFAADVEPLVCGTGDYIDYSTMNLPMAAVTATEDGVLNFTRWEENVQFLSNSTLFVSIEGGNHGQFGDYNDTLRGPILGQMDGEATISPQEQWNISVNSILEVILLATENNVESPTVSPTMDGGATPSPTSNCGRTTNKRTTRIIAPLALLSIILLGL
ncbi:alpha/beta fold family hydrolase [Nitzschia inconspicua]|uniref:Alpha/beta fold family hydrolase n=1 Tax=Nitzschia inconspicua TaxID=303405 RepID=A0A9K3L7J2_9STRA|nr:alpha/beta fold family hydrolase [Nitzschia inconspicua]